MFAIQTFKEKEGETFHFTWERFKKTPVIVPHHGFEKHQTVGYFYSGVSQASRQLIDTMCNREFLDKSPTDAWENLEKLAENNQSWDYSDPSYRSNTNASANSPSTFQLMKKYDLHKKVDTLTRKLEAMELS